MNRKLTAALVAVALALTLTAVAAARGVVTIKGTEKAETLTGSAGVDDMVGGRGADILNGNGGADVLIGGSGDDVIRVSDVTFLRIDGGTGTDTMAVDGSGVAVDLTTIANPRLQDIEVIDLTGSGNNSLALSAREVLNLSTSSNTLRVDGNAGDSVSFADGNAKWTKGATAGGFTTFTNGNATVQINTDVTAPCFAAGSRILTTRGEVAVEELVAGDRVPVLLGGGERQVRWIGHRRMHIAGHPRPWDVQPVRVVAHAFGPDMPHSDLRLSPDHAVFAEGVLVPVRYLINGTTIVQEAVKTVACYHVELADAAGAATHNVVLAQGLPTESFLDTGNRAAFANGGAAVMMHADFALKQWEARACTPLVLDGPALADIRTVLFAQATALGHGITADPDLHLVVDGVMVRADWTDPTSTATEHGFVLPEGARDVRIMSRTTVPAELRSDTDDRRQLGVAVVRLVVDGTEIALDDARLSDGWHAAEDGWRWTQGDAIVPCAGGCVLEVNVAPFERYWTCADAGTSGRLLEVA